MAELVAPGNESPSLRRMGAWSGGPVRTAAAIPACHWPLSTSVTAFGRLAALEDGNSAVATPAASVTESLPLTRVVSRVAATGLPGCARARLLAGGMPFPA